MRISVLVATKIKNLFIMQDFVIPVVNSTCTLLFMGKVKVQFEFVGH